MKDEMTDDEFRLLRTLIQDESGLHFDDRQRPFFARQIRKRIDAKNLHSFFSYFRWLDRPIHERRQELALLLDLLTINQTSFFRNRPQFDLLEGTVIPELVESRKDTRRLRLWSAGCSTGEEPYSLAISLLETIPNADSWKIEIFASDLSLSALGSAFRGVYSAQRLETISRARIEKYFLSHADGHQIIPKLREMIVYDFHNLSHENGLSGLDIIFCRNVLIYFDDAGRRTVWNRFVAALSAGGYLFPGHSESMSGLYPELEFVYENSGSAYRKVEAA